MSWDSISAKRCGVSGINAAYEEGTVADVWPPEHIPSQHPPADFNKLVPSTYSNEYWPNSRLLNSKSWFNFFSLFFFFNSPARLTLPLIWLVSRVRKRSQRSTSSTPYTWRTRWVRQGPAADSNLPAVRTVTVPLHYTYHHKCRDCFVAIPQTFIHCILLYRYVFLWSAIFICRLFNNIPAQTQNRLVKIITFSLSP